MGRGLLTGISKFAPASISIWTMASSPAAQAYMRGVIPFRKKIKNKNKSYLSIPINSDTVMDTAGLNLDVQCVRRDSIPMFIKHFSFLCRVGTTDTGK